MSRTSSWEPSWRRLGGVLGGRVIGRLRKISQTSIKITAGGKNVAHFVLGAVLEASWRRLGHVLGANIAPSWPPKSSPNRQTIGKNHRWSEKCRALRLGSRLGGVLEASWARLRGQHSSKLASKVEPKSLKHRCKNRSKN